MKKLFYNWVSMCLALFCMILTFSSCTDNDSNQVTLIERHANDDVDIDQQLASEIKTAYCRYTCEKNYDGESRFKPSDMYVLRYEGKIGDCQIVMMGGDDIDYTMAVRVVEIAGYKLVFGNGQPVYAYYLGNFYTIKEAYIAKLLNKDDVYRIGEIFSGFTSTNTQMQ